MNQQFNNLMANLACQLETEREKAIREMDLFVARHYASRAEGILYAVRVLHAMRPEFPGEPESDADCQCLACVAGVTDELGFTLQTRESGV